MEDDSINLLFSRVGGFVIAVLIIIIPILLII
jgi:hypothetical protein